MTMTQNWVLSRRRICWKDIKKDLKKCNAVMQSSRNRAVKNPDALINVCQAIASIMT